MRPLSIKRLYMDATGAIAVVPRPCDSTQFEFVYRAANYVRWHYQQFAFTMIAASLPGVLDQAVAIHHAVADELGTILVLDEHSEIDESLHPFTDDLRGIFA